MSDDLDLLLSLQHGDSFFPTGSVAFSSGLEGLCRDGLVRNADDLLGFIQGQVLGRWATCDLPAVLAAYRADGNLAVVGAADAALDAITLPLHLREGSRRSGAAMLGVHDKLGTAAAGPYRRMVRSGVAPGHLAIIQGLLWFQLGATEFSVAAISAHATTVSMLGAAIRLSVVGHIDAQRILATAHQTILGVLANLPSSDVDNFSSYGPAAEISIMRHETRESRLFFN